MIRRWTRFAIALVLLQTTVAHAELTELQKTLSEYGDSLDKMGSYVLAKRGIDALVKQYPERDTHNFAAIVYLLSRQWAKAHEVCEPGYREAKQAEDAGDAAARARNKGGPAPLVDAQATLDNKGPKTRTFQFCLAWSSMMLGRFEDAAKEAEALLGKGDPNEATLFVAISSHLQQRHYQAAQKWAELAMGTTSPDRAPVFIYYTRGMWLYSEKQLRPISVPTPMALFYRAVALSKTWTRESDRAVFAEMTKLTQEFQQARDREADSSRYSQNREGGILESGEQLRYFLFKFVSEELDMLQAELHMRAFRFDDASRILRSAHLAPDAYARKVMLAEIYRHKGDYNKMIDVADAASEMRPTGVLNAALFYSMLGADLTQNDTKLQKYIDQALATKHPWLVAAATAFSGRILERANKLSEANAVYDKAVALAAPFTNDLPSAYAHLFRGRVLRSNRQFDAADKELAQAVSEDDDAFFFGEWAMNAEAARAHAQAEVRFKKSIERRPDFDFLWSHLAVAQEAQGKDKDSMASLDKALALAPKNADTLAKRGYLKNKLNDRAGALVDLDAALAIAPNFAWALDQRARAHAALGHATEAEADKAKAAALRK